jgi:phosphoglycolate phosphatase-like HAD superfamily hydrolase
MIVADGAFADADAVFAAAVEHVARKYAAIRPLDATALPSDRSAAIAALDEWAGDRSWRAELVRFYEAHAPVLLRPDPALNGLLRRARRSGVDLTVVSPLPRAAAELFLSHLGVLRSTTGVLGEEDAPHQPHIASRAALEQALAR